MAQEKHPFNEAGRKLKAAITSSLLRRKGVDSTLKEMPEIVGHDWAELAERLMRDVNAKWKSGYSPHVKDQSGFNKHWEPPKDVSHFAHYV